ncbi:hypothetical protein SAMN06265219_10239 [Gracilimonas mengyeensis]|uniref:Uncharacterized protein n=1 Tax=Gracilimonas mengyeensis TaxID=1302730 RepID=A0A521B5R8_9BACT|nr:hypothetical protein SAMN06265219_10239 [Gracilimonas mengyeensis]
MYYLKLILGIYFIISSINRFLTSDHLLLVHNTSDFYPVSKLFLAIVECGIASLLLISSRQKLVVFVGLFLIIPGLIIALVNLLLNFGPSCQIGYTTNPPLFSLLQKTLLSILLMLVYNVKGSSINTVISRFNS